MERRHATAAVIGAGDFIGAAIARKFAHEGFTIFAGRRNGDKLAPLVQQIEAAGGRSSPARSTRGRRTEITAFMQRRRPRGAAGGLHLQHRRQRQFPAAGNHRAGVPQGVGDGVLRRLPRRAGGGAADAAARPGRDLLHRRHRQPARRHRLRRVRRRQVRPARGRAKCGAGTRSAATSMSRIW